MGRDRLSCFGVIGQEIVADGIVVATLSEAAPASIADAFRFAMQDREASKLYVKYRDQGYTK